MDSLLNPDPLLSLKTLGVFTLTAAPALVMGLRLRPIDLCRVAALVLIVGCALSAVVSLALPSVGTMPSGTEAGVYQIGGWKGLYTHKNHLGHIAGLTFGAMLLTGRGLFKDIRWWIVGLAAAAICMFGAKSSTAYVLAAALPVFYFAVAKPRGVLRYFSIFFSCLVFFTLLLFRDDIVHFALGLLGRNSSLSGRTDIWLHAGEMIMQRPVFGGGFGFSASDSYHEAITARFGVAYTHNEYLDLLLNIGAVGLILNLSLLGYAAWQSWRRRPSESTAMARNFLTLLLFGVVISGWSEGHGVEVTQVMMLSLFGLFGVAMGEARAARQSRPSRARSRSADLTAQAPQAT
ncbi:MAG TPA: O-antigen ligase family protein [Caulobacteraceae bacterium]|nr:O-antigen ligase family protein [Caulobacteraceae bacterium]